MITELNEILEYINTLKHNKTDYNSLINQPEKVHLLINAKLNSENAKKFKNQLMAIKDELESGAYHEKPFEKGKKELTDCIKEIIKI